MIVQVGILLTLWVVSNYDYCVVGKVQRNAVGMACQDSQVEEESSPSLGRSEDSSSSICILETDALDLAPLADALSLPLLPQTKIVERDTVFSHVLTAVPYEFHNVVDYAVGIVAVDRGTNRKRKAKPKLSSMKPFYVDFLPPDLSRLGRRATGESGKDLLLKAVAPRKGCPMDGATTVYDLTAGFGQDSLLIASDDAVKSVHMVERDPIVAVLLEDALRRLRVLSRDCSDDTVRGRATKLAHCLHLIKGDGCVVAKELSKIEDNKRPDIIYLDPMFPERKKSSLVKKNMQILHGLLSSQDIDPSSRLHQEKELLNSACSAARVRVVVKRPTNAPRLGQERLQPGMSAPMPQISYTQEGPVNRWDVYQL